jgi:NADH-quinone oxidoreductase subunit N
MSQLATRHRSTPFSRGCCFSDDRAASCDLTPCRCSGIPPLAGFFGKFAVFTGALKLNGLAGWAGWLSVFAIAMSAVGLYYYLLVLKNAVVIPGRADAAPIKVPLAAATALLVAAGLILVLGLFPSAVLQAIS